MRIGILCASDDELAPFLSFLDERTITEKARLKFYGGKVFDHDVVAVYSGVCKVNAAIAAQILIETFQADAVINSGTAGGMRSGLDILDTVISTEMVYHDVSADILTDFHPWMKTEFFYADKDLLRASKKAVQKLNLPHRVLWGRMATGEAFIDTANRQTINEKYAPLSVDMETASIAHVCYVFDIPFISIRSITDTAEHSGETVFEENCLAASTIARDITLALIHELSGIPAFSRKTQTCPDRHR